jgi:hypothetical protein
MDKSSYVLLSYRMTQIRKHDVILYSNTDEIMQKELKLNQDDITIESMLSDQSKP